MADSENIKEEMDESRQQDALDTPAEERAGETVDSAAEDTAEAAGQGTGEDVGEDPAQGSEEKPECKNTSNVVGIRFPNSGKTYCFCAGDLKLGRYDRVVVESDLGINIGQVAKVTCEMNVPEKGLKPVLRKVTEVDLQQEAENESVKREARDYAVERIKARGLPMKLLYADVTLDRKRFIFYFVADTRIDFRELVKDLASKFRSRIELRQIGVRDAAKMIGGFGVCGQELCCKTWLKGFAPISIKMAKQQDLVLNTCKLSGLCGRLMCCLNYEYDPNGPKRRKPEQRRREAPSTEEMDKAIESAIGAGQKEGAPAARAEAEAPSGEPVEVPAGQERPEQGGRPAEKRKRRRRRGGRNRKKQAHPSDGAAQAAGEAVPQKEGAASPTGGQAGAREQKEGGQAKKDKPRRPRRRRRRPKAKKEE
jgi:cell fate regulator YaaT (PSP1 superfamily)